MIIELWTNATNEEYIIYREKKYTENRIKPLGDRDPTELNIYGKNDVNKPPEISNIVLWGRRFKSLTTSSINQCSIKH